MKKMKKIVGIMLTMIMAIAMMTTAFAAGGTITINKAQDGNTYKIYKVFDAVGNGSNISYKLVSGKTTAPEGFEVDDAGNVTGDFESLTPEIISAIASYVTDSDLVDTVVASGTTAVSKNLANGYYYITTTTGTAVTITSTNPNAEVNDKNVAPELDKKITGVEYGSFDADGKKALAEVGSKVTYTATIKVETGAVGYVFHDKMSEGLEYNDDVAVKIGDTVVDSSNYDKTTASGDTITIKFNDSWIKEQVGKTITVTYTATVTSDALSVTPEKNTAKLDYGHNGKVNTTPEKINRNI